jgi:YD repeat-containing protein
MESNTYDLAASQVNDHGSFSWQESYNTVNSSTGYDAVNHVPYSDSSFDMSDEYYIENGWGQAGTPITFQVTVRMSSSTDYLQLNNTDLIYFAFYGSRGNLVLTKDLGNLVTCNGSVTTGCLMDNNGVYTYTYPDLYLPPDKYTVRTYVDRSQTKVIDLLVNWNWKAKTAGGPVESAAGTISNYGFAGGLRAKRIVNHDGVDPANDHVIHYVYHYKADKGAGLTEYSYGRRMSRPQYFYFDYVYSMIAQSNNNGNTFYISYASNHLFRSADSQNPLNGSASGSVVGYDQVSVLDGENGENGKSVYNYYNQPDYTNDYSFYDGLPHRPPTGSSISYQMNGTLLHETNFANVNGAYYKKKEVVWGYNAYPLHQNTSYGVEIRAPLTDPNNVTTAAGTNCGNFLYFYPAMVSQWNQLLEKRERIFPTNSDSVHYQEMLTRYLYTNPHHFQPTQTYYVNSKGDTVSSYFRYPLDLVTQTSGDAFNNGINRLNAAHIIDQPVEVYQQRNPVDGSASFITKGVLTSFNATLPKPSLIYNLDLSSPDFSFAAATAGVTSIWDPNYKGSISIDQYDSNGNILQQRKVNDVIHSYIYDYNNSLPVAEVSNAVYSDVAYTSFESNGTGGWSLGQGSVDVSKGLTGGSSYSMSDSIWKTGLNTASSYVVSYWTKNSSAFSIAGTISGYPIQGKSVTINGQTWTYFEHQVTGRSKITVTGSGGIDELRLYPASAQMKTSTYDPLIGITSQCDVVGRVAYYEYDGLGRLKVLRDQDGNIVRTYQYHYKQQ